MHILIEFCVVTYKIIWSLVLAGLKWVVHPPEKSVVGQVCLITGAGGALGRLFAEQFARRGASLVLWDINRQSNDKTAEKVREIYKELKSSDGPSESEDEVRLSRPQVYTYLCDVGKREQVYQMAEKVRCEVGDVDILINIAAVISGQHLLDCPDQLIERTLRVNCHALFWTSKAFLPRMLERDSGHIVTVTSSLGVFSGAGVEDYCAGKFGAVGFHESLSHELKALEKEGVKMTLVCPALLDLDLYKGCHIRKECGASLFPPMDPEQCVRKATRAILTNEPMICTPRRIYTISFLKTILPFDAMVCMYRFLGVTQCMSPFQAHRKEVSNNNESNMEE